MATFPSKVNYATGDILTATNMNDVGGAINLLDGAQRSAGKNAIINGDFGIWQRGTSFSAGAYNADRWYTASDATVTTSQQTFTAGTAPVAGYESQYFLRQAKSAGGTYSQLQYRAEDVRIFANQVTTLSFWAKADSNVTLAPYCTQNFGSGGSTQVDTALSTVAITTSWVRYSITFTPPSVSGKTIGTSSYVQLTPTRISTASAVTIDIWGVQWEAANTASPFQTATGTKQGELAACQRYYYRQTANNNAYQNFGFGMVTNSTTSARIQISNPVTMRSVPTSIDFATLRTTDYGSGYAVSAVTFGETSFYTTWLTITMAAGTAYRPVALGADNSTSGYIGISAEL
jgi:hypothetical protein